jgi:hypothetical protein
MVTLSKLVLQMERDKLTSVGCGGFCSQLLFMVAVEFSISAVGGFDRVCALLLDFSSDFFPASHFSIWPFSSHMGVMVSSRSFTEK